MGDLERIFRVIVPPLLTFYVIFLAMLRSAVRHPPERARFAPPRPWGGFLRWLAGIALPGYGVFLLIVFLFHHLTSAERDAMVSALTEGGLLLAMVLPLLVLLSVLEAWVRRRAREGS